jgi:hypothetical protein
VLAQSSDFDNMERNLKWSFSTFTSLHLEAPSGKRKTFSICQMIANWSGEIPVATLKIARREKFAFIKSADKKIYFDSLHTMEINFAPSMAQWNGENRLINWIDRLTIGNQVILHRR